MKLLFILMTFLTLSTSAFSFGGYSAGQWYSQRASVQAQCGYSYYNNWGQCVQSCQVANWYQECGGGNAMVWSCNYYGNCAWISQWVNGCRWAFNWVNVTRGCGF